MTIKLGNKADGEDFFDRVTEREDLWRYLEGNHPSSLSDLKSVTQ